MRTPIFIGCATVLAALVCAAPAAAQGRRADASHGMAARPPLTVPTEVIAAGFRDRVNHVLRDPTLVARAAPEQFEQGIYDWLVEHPDRASLAWHRLGVPCAPIAVHGGGRFGWTDGDGTEIVWWTVVQADNVHVWYAEGRAKLGSMIPAVQVRAVAVLSHVKRPGPHGRATVTHETTVYLQTDSKAAALVARLLGPAAPRLADQGASQLLLFFSGLTRYFVEHPDDIPIILAAKP